MEFIESILVKGSEYHLQATYDSAGNVIVDTYATHENVESVVNEKIADLVDSAPENLNTLNELSKALNDNADYANTITQELAKKANLVNVYTKSEIDLLEINLKNDTETKYNTLSGILVTKANSADVYVKELTYTKAEVDNIVNKKSDKSDTYTKDEVYNKSEVDDAFSTLRSELPTKVSAFENDSEYLVWNQVEHFAVAETVNTALDTKVDKIENYGLMPNESIAKVAALPTREQYDERMTLLDEAIKNMGANIDGAMLKNTEQDTLILANTEAISIEKTRAEGEEAAIRSEFVAADEVLAAQIEEKVGLHTQDITTLQELITNNADQITILLAKIEELENRILTLEAKHVESDPELEVTPEGSES